MLDTLMEEYNVYTNESDESNVDTYHVNGSYETLERSSTLTLACTIASFALYADIGTPLPEILVPRFDKPIEF